MDFNKIRNIEIGISTNRTDDRPIGDFLILEGIKQGHPNILVRDRSHVLDIGIFESLLDETIKKIYESEDDDSSRFEATVDLMHVPLLRDIDTNIRRDGGCNFSVVFDFYFDYEVKCNLLMRFIVKRVDEKSLDLRCIADADFSDGVESSIWEVITFLYCHFKIHDLSKRSGRLKDSRLLNTFRYNRILPNHIQIAQISDPSMLKGDYSNVFVSGIQDGYYIGDSSVPSEIYYIPMESIDPIDLPVDHWSKTFKLWIQ